MLSWCFVLIFSLCSLQVNVFAFSFTNTDPTQCDNLTVNWQGGTAPFLLHLIPVFDAPRNITLPPTAFNNGQGSYSVQVPFAKNKQMLIVMSDAGGFGTGGVSDVMVVGQSRGATCDTKGPGVSFTYQLNTALQQCRPYTISDYTDAIQPVTVYGIIPRGQSFVLHPKAGPTSYDWTANVASGMDVVFFMVDAQGRQGGSSDVTRVGVSDDSTCINSSSPSSTTSAPPSSQTSGPNATSAPENNTTQGGFTIAAIAGTVIGAVLFLAVVITMSLYFFRRKRATYPRPPQFSLHDENPAIPIADMPGATPNPYPYSASALSMNASIYPLRPMDPYGAATPSHQYQSVSHHSFSGSNSISDFGSTFPALSNPHGPLLSPDPRTEAGSSTSARDSSFYTNRSVPPTTSEKARAVSLSPARYIVHTDAEDFSPQPDENGVVELPPVYTERQALRTVANPTPESELPYA